MTNLTGFCGSSAENPSQLTPSEGSEKYKLMYLKHVFTMGTQDSFRQAKGRRETQLCWVHGGRASIAQVAVLLPRTAVSWQRSPQTDALLTLAIQAASLDKNYFSDQKIFPLILLFPLFFSPIIHD